MFMHVHACVSVCVHRLAVCLPPTVPVRVNGHGGKGDKDRPPHTYDVSSSLMSSDIDTTSFMDSEEDASSRWRPLTATHSTSARYPQPSPHQLSNT